MQLVKVDGDVNPADVFTKHSLSRERLMKLMKLYDCRYTSGRAESAPQTRAAAEGRLTMADADAVQAVQSKGETSTEDRDPDMPHLRLPRSLLERLHPALVLPADQDDEADLRDDDEDGILVEGDRIINEIMDEARAYGRRRSLRPNTTTTTTTTVRAAEACPGSAGPARQLPRRPRQSGLPRPVPARLARRDNYHDDHDSPGCRGLSRLGWPGETKRQGGVFRVALLEALGLARDALGMPNCAAGQSFVVLRLRCMHVYFRFLGIARNRKA
jgi:hypothetical protein